MAKDKPKFYINRAGGRALMQSTEMQNLLRELASGVQGRAGSGFESEIYVAGTRAVATVSAATREAYRDNLQNNTLSKALR